MYFGASNDEKNTIVQAGKHVIELSLSKVCSFQSLGFQIDDKLNHSYLYPPLKFIANEFILYYSLLTIS